MPIRWPLTNADQVRRYVALTGATCPRCRYCLRGLRAPLCPECGTHLTVELLARPRGLAAARASLLGPDSSFRPLNLLAALNILTAAAILASSLLNSGRLPLLAWLAPGILGAAVLSIQYVAVFTRAAPLRHDPDSAWPEALAALILLIQGAGLILIWL